jgi:hypothetical protein
MNFLLAMTDDQQDWSELLQEIEALYAIHEKIGQSSGCREFNRRAALLLQRLEDAGFSRLADRCMDLLASCNPKELSQCDSIQRALLRLRNLAEEDAEKDKG